MPERLNGTVSKIVDPFGSLGSNPSPSVYQHDAIRHHVVNIDDLIRTHNGFDKFEILEFGM